MTTHAVNDRNRDFESIDDAIANVSDRNRPLHLLLGNGFSRAYGDQIFNYNALHAKLLENATGVQKDLIDALKAVDFEEMMQSLSLTQAVMTALGAKWDDINKVVSSSDWLKRRLIEIISELHPNHTFEVEDGNVTKCAQFLKRFTSRNGHIFTTNYDLLLYWVHMRSIDLRDSVEDGFGNDEHKDLVWTRNESKQRVHYLHGALHLFKGKRGETYKERFQGHGGPEPYIMHAIKKRIEGSEYPIFVTSGDGIEKRLQISKSPYLDYCYSQLSSLKAASLFTFGLSFSESDQHLVDALQASARKPYGLLSVYIGVFNEIDMQRANQLRMQLKTAGNQPLKVHTFDAKNVTLW